MAEEHALLCQRLVCYAIHVADKKDSFLCHRVPYVSYQTAVMVHTQYICHVIL